MSVMVKYWLHGLFPKEPDCLTEEVRQFCEHIAHYSADLLSLRD